MTTEKLLESITNILDKCLTLENDGNKVTSEVDTPIVKSLNEMKRLALFIALEPQSETLETSDLHGHWYDEEEVRKACHDYNVHCGRIGTMHKSLLTNNDVSVVESYTAPCDFTTEDGEFVKKGSWLMWLHFPNDEEWQKVLDGTYDGVSIECSGVEYLLDDED